ncbi:MAG TPA: tetratricopeptide repeat protein, partial [Pirellulales bacterium]|nr:tetratricopeptide repeat protein [Pirellulales bacterium]
MSARDAGTNLDRNVRTARKLIALASWAALLIFLTVSGVQPSLGAGGLASIDAYNIGRYHYAQGEYAKAVEAYSEALARNPKFGVVYLARAKAYFQLGKQHEALTDSTTALKFRPHFVDALVTRGEVHAALGNLKAALSDFDLAINLEPQNAVTFQRRGQVYEAQGRADLAAADLKTALAIDPLLTDLPPLRRADQADHRPPPKSDVAAVPEPGVGALAQVDDSRAPASRLPAAAAATAQEPATAAPLFTAPPPVAPAIAAARQALAGRPQLPRIQEASSPEIASAAARQCFQRGQQLSAAQQWNDARAAFTQALDLDPQLTAAYGERGRAALAAGQHTQAIADYDALLQHSPGVAQGYFDRGRAHAALGHGLQALADFDAAIRLRPDNASFYAARAEAQAGLGHDQLAEDDRQAAARLNAETAGAGKAPGGDLATSETPAAADGLAPTDAAIQSSALLVAAETTTGAPAADATMLLAQPLGIDNRASFEAVPVAVDDNAASAGAETDRSETPAAMQPEPSQPPAVVANATPIPAPPALAQPTANDQPPTNDQPPAHVQPLVEFANDAGREPNRLEAAQPAVGSEMVSSIAVVADGRSGAVVPASASNAIAGELPPRDKLARLTQLNQQLRTNPEDAERYLERAEIHVDFMRWEEALA